MERFPSNPRSETNAISKHNILGFCWGIVMYMGVCGKRFELGVGFGRVRPRQK